VPSSFYETVVSFSNTDGGTILLGVDDNGIIKGIDPDAEVSLMKNIITALNSKDCIDPPVYVEPFCIQQQVGKVMVIQIPASSQIHNHSGSIYSRNFESDLDITKNQQRLSDLYLRKRNFFTEAIIYEHLSMADLDENLFDKVFKLIRNIKSDHPWLLAGKEQLLKEATLWRKDFQTGQEGLTLAAALIFGKDETIQSLLPAYKV
jgi:ATP-dependent DNA helicase RecG